MRYAFITTALVLPLTVVAGLIDRDTPSIPTNPDDLLGMTLHKTTSSISTTTITIMPSSTTSFKAKETVSIESPASRRPPLDPYTVQGADTVFSTQGKQSNFSLVALPQSPVRNEFGSLTADEDHSNNKTIGLRKFGEDIFLIDLHDNVTASQRPVRYNLVKGRLETDDKASSIHDVLYLNLIRWKHKDVPDDLYYPIWTTNKGKKSIHDNNLVKKLQWKLVLDKGEGFYRLESKLAGDWSYCLSPPSIAQKGSVLDIDNTLWKDGFDAVHMFESLIYGNRANLPASWDCTDYGVEAIWA